MLQQVITYLMNVSINSTNSFISKTENFIVNCVGQIYDDVMT